MRARGIGALLLLALFLSACTGGGTSGARTSSTTASGTSSTSTQARSDIATENAKPGDPSWRLTKAQTATLAALSGYASPGSVRPGEPVALHVRASTAYSITAFRMGWYAGAGARRIWRSASLPRVAQPDPVLKPGRMAVAGWSVTSTLATAGWPAGDYLLLLRSVDGKGAYIPLTVRSASAQGRLVLVNPTTTWEAYNGFGDYSLYKGAGGRPHATRVSYDRPLDDNAGHFVLDDYPLVSLGERAGLPMSYVNSEDLETPGILAGARGVISVGHDEYWSLPMRAAVTAARDAGANVAFFGGNELYWRVRFDAGHRVLIGYKQFAASDPVQGPATTAMWRSYPSPRPENSLTGLVYECYPVNGPWTVTTPTWFGYAGTGVRTGTSFAGLIGVESDRAYPVPGTPSTLQVVADSAVSCGPHGHSRHDAGYYTASSGAGVVAVGTINWALNVGRTNGDKRSQDFARAVTLNVMRAMAAGPMGRRYPSTPNISSLHLSPSTSQGTAGQAVFTGK